MIIEQKRTKSGAVQTIITDETKKVDFSAMLRDLMHLQTVVDEEDDGNG